MRPDVGERDSFLVPLHVLLFSSTAGTIGLDNPQRDGPQLQIERDVKSFLSLWEGEGRISTVQPVKLPGWNHPREEPQCNHGCECNCNCNRKAR